tara:strand:+ start:979 stop:1422 length:444 start_codon:yes stop_codon:yes gene_type:complete
MVQSFAPTFTLAQMGGPKALVLSLSRTPMMHAMQSSNSMATIGKVVHLRSEKIASPVPVQDLVAVVDLGADAEVSAVDSLAVVVQVLEAAVVLEVASVEVVAALEEDMEVELQLAATTLAPLLRLQTHSLTTLLLVPKEARSFMSET